MADSKLPLHLVAFGVGQIAEGVKNTGFATFLLIYYNQVLGLSGSLAGLAIMIALCFDAVLIPSRDRSRTISVLAGAADTRSCTRRQFRSAFASIYCSFRPRTRRAESVSLADRARRAHAQRHGAINAAPCA